MVDAPPARLVRHRQEFSRHSPHACTAKISRHRQAWPILLNVR
jgi:hypothetical protein